MMVVGKDADRDLVMRFGIPAIIAAFAGAWTLGYVSGFGELARYSIGSKIAVITLIKGLMGILMFVFAMFELLPVLWDLRVDRKYLFWGGQWPLILSGIFAAFAGLMIGKRWMHKVTMKTV